MTDQEQKSPKLEAAELMDREKTKEIFTPGFQFQVEGMDRYTLTHYERGNSVEKWLTNAEVVTLGDLHGSALKLLETAILAGLVTLPPEEAEEFKELYEAMALNYAKIPAFEIKDLRPTDGLFYNQIKIKKFTEAQKRLLQIIEKMQWTGKDRKLILLGDTLADRGLSDTLTLKILKKIQEKGNLISIASNHDLAYIPSLKTQGPSYIDSLSKNRAYKVASSEEKLELGEEAKRQLQSQQLFYYEPKTKSLFVHAIIKKRQVKRLAEMLGLDDDVTPEIFVEKSNEWYKKIIKKVILGDPTDETETDFLVELLWERDGYRTEEEMPFFGKINHLVHGHSSRRSLPSYSTICKERGYNYNHNGYNVVDLNGENRSAIDSPSREIEHDAPSKMFILMPEDLK